LSVDSKSSKIKRFYRESRLFLDDSLRVKAVEAVVFPRGETRLGTNKWGRGHRKTLSSEEEQRGFAGYRSADMKKPWHS